MSGPVHPEVTEVTRAEDRLAEFVDNVESALEHEATAERLARAGVVVRIEVTDLHGDGVTLLLDRQPAGIVRAPAPDADAVLRLSSQELCDLWGDGPFPAIRILQGAVAFEGDVRRFLRVFPILRSAVLRDREPEAVAP